MAVVQRRIDSAATGAYMLREVTATSNASTQLSISDSANALELPSEMRMSRRDFKLFLVALERDKEPNEKLRALFRDHE